MAQSYQETLNQIAKAKAELKVKSMKLDLRQAKTENSMLKAANQKLQQKLARYQAAFQRQNQNQRPMQQSNNGQQQRPMQQRQ